MDTWCYSCKTLQNFHPFEILKHFTGFEFQFKCRRQLLAHSERRILADGVELRRDFSSGKPIVFYQFQTVLIQQNTQEVRKRNFIASQPVSINQDARQCRHKTVKTIAAISFFSIILPYNIEKFDYLFAARCVIFDE